MYDLRLVSLRTVWMQAGGPVHHHETCPGLPLPTENELAWKPTKPPNGEARQAGDFVHRAFRPPY